MTRIHFAAAVAGIFTLGLAGCGQEVESSAAEAPVEVEAAAAPAEPSAGEQEYARLTANWSPEALEGCGRTLKEALGTRDLVRGALAGVEDPEGKATAELEDARHWMEVGDEAFEKVRPQLEAGTCTPDVTLAMDEAVQAYVKTGTAAVQAGQIAGS